jgi:uncharacterized membrane protein SpoIIM required for sporulation
LPGIAIARNHRAVFVSHPEPEEAMGSFSTMHLIIGVGVLLIPAMLLIAVVAIVVAIVLASSKKNRDKNPQGVAKNRHAFCRFCGSALVHPFAFCPKCGAQTKRSGTPQSEDFHLQ